MPTRGTTLSYVSVSSKYLFQSTCPRGARLIEPEEVEVVEEFQSTCPRGARLMEKVYNKKFDISIHVPTRGTTHAIIFDELISLFQSTCPRGARRGNIWIFVFRRYFNPRAHEGHDQPPQPPQPQTIFQSTCPRGARRADVYVGSSGKQFQSTCPRGARRCTVLSLVANSSFQSTCPRGARHVIALIILIIINFNPRAHEGHDMINL